MMFTGLLSLYPICSYFFRIHTKRFSNQKKQLLSVIPVSYQETSVINLLPDHQIYILTREYLLPLPTKLEVSSENIQGNQDSFPPSPAYHLSYCLNVLGYHMMWRCLLFFWRKKRWHWQSVQFCYYWCSNVLTCNRPMVLLDFILCSISLNYSLLFLNLWP